MLMHPLSAKATHPVLLPATPFPRRATAIVLRKAIELLQHLARALADMPERSVRDAAPSLEFYAEAGAPEGALYIDGQLVALLSGVQRL